MKKVYLSFLLAGFVANGAMAQMVKPSYAFGEKNRSISENKTAPSSQASNRAVYWTETFGGIGNGTASTAGPSFTTSNGTWTTGGADGNIWKHTYWPSSGEWATGIDPFASTSANNGFMAFDADSVNTPLGQANYTTLTGELISPVIDLSLAPSAMLVMEQEFRYCCSGTHQLNLQVSNDGGATWSAPINLSTGVGANDIYSDIMGSYDVNANITALAAGQNNVKIKLTWAGDASGSSHYYWTVDDIRIEDAPTNDLVAYDPYWGTDGLFYHQIPTMQVAPIDFQTVVFNNGVAPQTNVTLDVDINSGFWTGASNVIASLAPNAFDTLLVTSPFTPAASLGTYNVTWMINQTETEESPANNTNDPFSFQVTDYIYARDNGVQDANRYNQGDGYEIGHLYDIWQDQTLKAVDVDLSSFTEVGSIVQAKVYAFDGSAPSFAQALSQVAISDYHTVTSADLTGILTLELLQPTLLTSTQMTYLVTIATDGNGGTGGNDMVVNTAGDGTSYFYDAPSNSWTSTSVLAMVRMNFDPVLGLNEVQNNVAVNVYPNPASEAVSLKYNLGNASNVTIVMTDLAGNTISTQEHGTQAAGEHTTTFNTNAIASGVYYVTVSTNEGAVTKKFIKK